LAVISIALEVLAAGHMVHPLELYCKQFNAFNETQVPLVVLSYPIEQLAILMLAPTVTCPVGSAKLFVVKIFERAEAFGDNK